MLSFHTASKPTCLCTDTSRQGLGFILQQQNNDTTWNLIQAGSCFLTDTESRHATVELEMLAVFWAVMKCNIFLAGLQLIIRNPLIPIINNRCLDELYEEPTPTKAQTKLMTYNFTAEWIKGKKNDALDAFLCNPILDQEKADKPAEIATNGHPEKTITEIRTLHGDTTESLRSQDIRKHAEEDLKYQQLCNFILHGFPAH